MKPPGRGLLVTASILLMVVAGLHAVGHFVPPEPGSDLARMVESMRQLHLDLGFGMRPSMEAIFASISLTMSLLLITLGACGLIAAWADDSGRTMRRSIVALFVAVLALIALYAHYRIPPPLISFVVVELVLLAALVRSRGGD